MEIKITDLTTWEAVKKAALFTIGKTKAVSEPTTEWIGGMLQREHSPIREKVYHIELIGIPYWIANHFRTHFIGTNFYISTSREDRNKEVTDRADLSQTSPVNMLVSLNAQALINISRKRLCSLAHRETRKVWEDVCKAMAEYDPVMAHFMVRECRYRNGFCPEGKNCGLFNKETF